VCLDVLVVGGCWLFALFHYSSFLSAGSGSGVSSTRQT
jgi:hypothetical protein